MHFKMIFLDLACQYLMVKDLFILQRVVVFVSAGRIGSLSGQCSVKRKRGRGSVPFIWVMLQITFKMTEIYQMYSGVGQGSKY